MEKLEVQLNGCGKQLQTVVLRIHENISQVVEDNTAGNDRKKKEETVMSLQKLLVKYAVDAQVVVGKALTFLSQSAVEGSPSSKVALPPRALVGAMTTLLSS